MKTRIAAIVFVALSLGIASAEELLIKGAPPPPAHSRPTVTRATPARPAPTVQPWIPAGKFGLVLDDGTRILGIPSKRWSATLQTGFTLVTIPRDQFSRIDTVANGVQVHLTNGDRISGTLLSSTMVFETQFGPLTVPARAIVRLSTRHAPQRPKAAATVESLMPRLQGNWVVTYTNKTQQTRKIHDNRLVNDADQLVQSNGDLLIEFPNVIERITLVEDKLFVEHFNPRSTYPDGIPVVMGIGRKTAGK